MVGVKGHVRTPHLKKRNRDTSQISLGDSTYQWVKETPFDSVRGKISSGANISSFFPISHIQNNVKSWKPQCPLAFCFFFLNYHAMADGYGTCHGPIGSSNVNGTDFLSGDFEDLSLGVLTAWFHKLIYKPSRLCLWTWTMTYLSKSLTGISKNLVRRSSVCCFICLLCQRAVGRQIWVEIDAEGICWLHGFLLFLWSISLNECAKLSVMNEELNAENVLLYLTPIWSKSVIVILK